MVFYKQARSESQEYKKPAIKVTEGNDSPFRFPKEFVIFEWMPCPSSLLPKPAIDRPFSPGRPGLKK